MNNKKFSPQELSKIIKADDLKISPFREDGKTYGRLPGFGRLK